MGLVFAYMNAPVFELVILLGLITFTNEIDLVLEGNEK